MTVTPSQDTVTIGNQILMATQVKTGTQVASEYSISWVSEDDGIATVSSEGIVTPVAPGQTYITATLTSVNGQALSSAVSVAVLAI